MENISFMRNGKEFKPTRAELERILDDFAERLAILEKALELACGQIWAMSIWENTKEETIQDNIKFFKDKAKEMIDET